MQCHSQAAIGDRKRYDETTFHKMCNATHKLLIVCMQKSGETGLHKMCNVTYFLLVIGKVVIDHRTAFHKLCDVTHFLLFIVTDVMKIPSMSLTRC